MDPLVGLLLLPFWDNSMFVATINMFIFILKQIRNCFTRVGELFCALLILIVHVVSIRRCVFVVDIAVTQFGDHVDGRTVIFWDGRQITQLRKAFILNAEVYVANEQLKFVSV